MKCIGYGELFEKCNNKTEKDSWYCKNCNDKKNKYRKTCAEIAVRGGYS